MVSDPIADFCTRIRNGYMARKKIIIVPLSGMNQELTKILEKEGYLEKFKIQSSKIKINRKELVIELKYNEVGEPAITKIERISKPGLRVYKKAKKLSKILSGFGMAIISTPKGLMTDAGARQENLGGEILCQIW